MRSRPYRIVFYLNDQELKELDLKVQKTRLPREVFIRKVLQEGTVREAPPADYPKLLRSLSKIGTNLNQIAATANTIHFINPKELNQAVGDLKHTMKQIHRSFQIPDKKRLQEEIASTLQYIYEETKKVLDGQGKEPSSQEVLRFIQAAVADKAERDNTSLREYRDSHPTMMLGFLSELYTPFQETTHKEDTE